MVVLLVRLELEVLIVVVLNKEDEWWWRKKRKYVEADYKERNFPILFLLNNTTQSYTDMLSCA